MTETSDSYTMELRLCDDHGIVGGEYIDVLNRLKAQSANPDTRRPYEGGPFACTGHAHLAGEHIRCTSPAHHTTVAAESLWMPTATGALVWDTTPPPDAATIEADMRKAFKAIEAGDARVMATIHHQNCAALTGGSVRDCNCGGDLFPVPLHEPRPLTQT